MSTTDPGGAQTYAEPIPLSSTEKLVRVLINVQVRTTDPPADNVVHTVHYSVSSVAPISTTAWNAFATAISNIFGGIGTGAFTLYAGRANTVKVYDMADTPPRAIIGEAFYTPGTPETGALGPREVACCLSFYGGKNIPGNRGRLFVGPFLSSTLAETVSSGTQGIISNLGKKLANVLVGDTSDWVVYSPTTVAVMPISVCWVNDQWDVMHSREHLELSRTTITVP